MSNIKTGWVTITYDMPATWESGQATKIRAGHEVHIESYDSGYGGDNEIYTVKLKGKTFKVKRADMDANGPKALFDMFKF